ncbi:lysozyme [Flavobacterium filum]|uniref:lysozyme n=1 Tax=Flavobacterium filum TaxID=370974 RepID=UPI0003F4FD86|nr:lysozyme [Flavobacterium filum]
MKTTQNGIQLLKNHEGLRLRAYDDLQPNLTITSASQIKGILTIGYGHTGTDVYVGQTITEAKAEEFLKADLIRFENNLNAKVLVPITSNIFDALISFSYNVGNGNFNKSTLLKLLNQNNYTDAAEEFLKWTKAGGKVLTGLVHRRNDERELFLNGIGVLQIETPSKNGLSALAKAAITLTLLG